MRLPASAAAERERPLRAPRRPSRADGACATFAALQRFDRRRARRATRDRRRSCRRSAPNRCASRRGSAAATASVPCAAREDVAGRIDARLEAGGAHHAEHVTAAGDVGVRVGDAADAVGERPARGTAECAQRLDALAQGHRIDLRALTMQSGHAHRPGAGRHRIGPNELASRHSHVGESTAAQAPKGPEERAGTVKSRGLSFQIFQSRHPSSCGLCVG